MQLTAGPTQSRNLLIESYFMEAKVYLAEFGIEINARPTTSRNALCEYVITRTIELPQCTRFI